MIKDRKNTMVGFSVKKISEHYRVRYLTSFCELHGGILCDGQCIKKNSESIALNESMYRKFWRFGPPGFGSFFESQK
jgi:hypothetical protein